MFSTEREKYKEVANRAEAIAIALGTKFEGCIPGDDPDYAYCDTAYYYYSYEYLSITYYTGRCSPYKQYVTININNKNVLTYYNDSDSLTYIEGGWVELVETINSNIDNIKEKRIRDKDAEMANYERYKSMKAYFMRYNSLSSSDIRTADFILNKEGITIKISTDSFLEGSARGESLYNSYYRRYDVYYEDKLVALFPSVFNDGTSTNLYKYSKKYIPGEWVDKFKSVMNFMEREEERKINDSANVMIKKIKDNYL